MGKVKNFCDHSMTLREMTDNLLTTGHFWPPPPVFFRVNQTSNKLFLFTACLFLSTSLDDLFHQASYIFPKKSLACCTSFMDSLKIIHRRTYKKLLCMRSAQFFVKLDPPCVVVKASRIYREKLQDLSWCEEYQLQQCSAHVIVVVSERKTKTETETGKTIYFSSVVREFFKNILRNPKSIRRVKIC